MLREKSPGVKILWVWTIGTAAIVMTSFVRTRLRDVENMIKAEEEQQQKQHQQLGQTRTFPSETVLADDTHESEGYKE